MLGMKTGGRRKGTPNKRSAELIKVIESGESPLQYMLGVMRDKKVAPERRDQMARAAALYLHPRLAAVEASGSDDGPNRPPMSINIRFLDPQGNEVEKASSKLLTMSDLDQ